MGLVDMHALCFGANTHCTLLHADRHESTKKALYLVSLPQETLTCLTQLFEAITVRHTL